jgi:trimeric autotransporter adhesin
VPFAANSKVYIFNLREDLKAKFEYFFSCNNGGTCIDGVDGFTCSCPPDVTGRYCECPIGQDCSNHTYHPSLPTTEPQYEISSTFLSNGTATKVTSYLPRTSTSRSMFSTASLVTQTSTIFQGENKESGEVENGEDPHATTSPGDVIGLDKSKTTAKDFGTSETSDFGVDKKPLPTEATAKYSTNLMPTFSPPLTSTLTGKLPESPISSTIVATDSSSATQPTTDDLSTTDLYKTSELYSSPAHVSSTESSLRTSTEVMGDNTSTRKGSKTEKGGDESHFSTPSDVGTTQLSATEETDVDDYEDSKLKKSTALPTESATPTNQTLMTYDWNSTFATSPFKEPTSTFSTTISHSDFTTGEAEIQSSSSSTIEVPHVPKIDDSKSTLTSIIDATELTTTSFQASFNFSDKTLAPTESATTDEYDYEESIMPEFNLTSSESSLVTKPHTLTPPEAFTSLMTSTQNTSMASSSRTEEKSTFSIYYSTHTATTQDMNQSSSTYIPVVVGSSTIMTVKASVGTESSSAVTLTTPLEASTAQVSTEDTDYGTEGHFDENESKDIPMTTTPEDRFPDYGTVTPDYVDTTVSEPRKCIGVESPCLNGGVCFSLESDTVVS